MSKLRISKIQIKRIKQQLLNKLYATKGIPPMANLFS